MLVRPHNGGVDDEVLEVWIFNQRIENTLPNVLLCPPTEALEHTIPVAKLTRQIAPRCSGTSQPKHSIHEQSIVLAVAPSVTFLTRNKRLDAPPLRIRKCSPKSRSTSSVSILNHIRKSEGIPYMSTGPSSDTPLRFSPTPRRARLLASACRERAGGRTRAPRPSRPACRCRCDGRGLPVTGRRCARGP